jgi:cobalamin biosynthesis Co2+ chelatase CbiK
MSKLQQLFIRLISPGLMIYGDRNRRCNDLRNDMSPKENHDIALFIHHGAISQYFPKYSPDKSRSDVRPTRYRVLYIQK